MRDNLRQIGIGAGLALLLGFAVAPMVSAQNTNGEPPPFMGRGMRGGPPPGGPGGLPPQVLNRLGLSDQQREQLQAIADAHRDDTRALADQQRDARAALQTAVQSGTFDEGVVRTQAMALGQIETDLAVQRARIFSEIYQILTPEQQTRLTALQQRRVGRSGPRGRGALRQGPNGPGDVGR